MAPLGSENLGAGAFVGGEEGDDVAEDGVGEAAGAVDASFIFFAHSGIGRFRLHRLRGLVGGLDPGWFRLWGWGLGAALLHLLCSLVVWKIDFVRTAKEKV